MLKPEGASLVGLWQLSKSGEGRQKINKILPPGWEIKKRVIRGDIEKLLTKFGKKNPNRLARVANKLTQLGNDQATYMGLSMGLSDMTVDDTKLRAIADKVEKDVLYFDRVSKLKGLATRKESERRKGEIMEKSLPKLDDEVKRLLMRGDNDLGKMITAGALGGSKITQLRQIIGPPMLFAKAEGDLVTVPVKNSFARGLTPSEYYVQQTGGRAGLIKRAVETGEPGDIGKDLLGINADNIITEEDCGTFDGISLPLGARDIMDRRLALPVLDIPRNTVVTPQVLEKLRRMKNVRSILVRSPLRCRARVGICQMCYGLDEMGNVPSIGTNVGVRDSQAIINRISHVALKSWHLTGGKEVKELPFDKFKRIINMPEKVHDQAILSTVSGKVHDIMKKKLDRKRVGSYV